MLNLTELPFKGEPGYLTPTKAIIAIDFHKIREFSYFNAKDMHLPETFVLGEGMEPPVPESVLVITMEYTERVWEKNQITEPNPPPTKNASDAHAYKSYMEYIKNLPQMILVERPVKMIYKGESAEIMFKAITEC